MPHAIAQWFSGHGIIAKPGASVFLVPWAASKANTNWSTRTQSSLVLGGGRLDNSSTQNDAMSWDVWLDDGTYKIAMVYTSNTSQGIHNFTGLNGTQTIDAYASPGGNNAYSEVTGVTVTKGLKTFQDQVATKNGSSSGYGGAVDSIAIIRTGA